jgi:hypothetical protein
LRQGTTKRERILAKVSESRIEPIAFKDEADINGKGLDEDYLNL